MVCRHPPTCPRGADQGRAITRAPNITRRALSGAPDRHIRAWLVLRTERRIWRGLDGRVACSGASFGRAPQPGARGWMIFGSSTALTGKLRTPVFFQRSLSLLPFLAIARDPPCNCWAIAARSATRPSLGSTIRASSAPTAAWSRARRSQTSVWTRTAGTPSGSRSRPTAPSTSPTFTVGRGSPTCGPSTKGGRVLK
jgi:hypothetical protein